MFGLFSSFSKKTHKLSQNAPLLGVHSMMLAKIEQAKECYRPQVQRFFRRRNDELLHQTWV